MSKDYKQQTIKQVKAELHTFIENANNEFEDNHDIERSVNKSTDIILSLIQRREIEAKIDAIKCLYDDKGSLGLLNNLTKSSKSRLKAQVLGYESQLKELDK